MQVSRDLTIAIHMLLCISHFHDENNVTSRFLAESVGVNPVIIRRLLVKLKDAGLITVRPGTGGASLAKDTKDISLYDIYQAVGCGQRKVFAFHENPNPRCPVGGNIHNLLDDRLDILQKTMETEMKTMSLNELIADLNARTR